MPKESNLELKVGSLVILAFAVLTYFVFSVGDFSPLEKGTTMRVIFNFASGIKKTAPVRIAGVETGMVKAVTLFFDRAENKTKVEVEIWVKKGTMIPADSRVLINHLGLLGEKYVEFLPGVDTKNFYRAGDTIIGEDPVIQAQISQKIMDVASNIEEGINSLKNVVSDPGNQDSLKMTLERFSSFAESIDSIADHVESGQGTVGKLFYDNTLYDELQGLAGDLRENPWKLLYKPKVKKK